MRIVNKTKWNTKQLRTIFTKCLQEIRKTEDIKWWRKLTVHVVWHRSWWVGGYAYYNSTLLIMKMPRKSFTEPVRDGLDFTQAVADTFIHEFGHCFGIKHGPSRKTIEHVYRDWIKATFSNETYPLSLDKAEKVMKENVIVKRYNQAMANCTRAATRVKRAKTIFEKWTRKVKYYETKMAMKGENHDETS